MLGIQYIDVSEVAEEFYLTKSEIDSFIQYILKSVTNRFKSELEKQAGEKLHQTRNQYIRSIYVESVSDTTTAVGINGFISNAVEEGIDPFDEKIGFLKSSKVKANKKGTGFYITIPFRFKSSEDVIGDSQSFSSAALPDEIHEILKQKGRSGDNSGMKLSEIPEQFRTPSSRPEIKFENKIFEEYIHKSPIYEGIKKGSEEYNSQYVSFRRVSDLSYLNNANAFIHPGIQPRNLFEASVNNIDIPLIVEKSVDAFLGTL